jgi:hypothetical protein
MSDAVFAASVMVSITRFEALHTKESDQLHFANKTINLGIH